MEKPNPDIKTATFAGGCFWCTQSDFEKQGGIIKTLTGYTGGHQPNPTYEDVCSGRTGHFEAVQLRYHKKHISYDELLDIFWRTVDPTDGSGQFTDRGAQYRTAIFYHDEGQKRLAEKARIALEHSGRFNHPIATEIREAQPFYPAEPHHQSYYRKNPLHYKFYRVNSGRDQFIHKVWSAKRQTTKKA